LIIGGGGIEILKIDP